MVSSMISNSNLSTLRFVPTVLSIYHLDLFVASPHCVRIQRVVTALAGSSRLTPQNLPIGKRFAFKKTHLKSQQARCLALSMSFYAQKW